MIKPSIGAGNQARALGWHVDYRGTARKAALRERIATVITTLDGTTPTAAATSQELLETLANTLRDCKPDEMWLALSVIGARMPSESEVLDAARRARLDGPLAGIADVIAIPNYPRTRAGLKARIARETRWPRVVVETGAVILDIHHTAGTDLATGIQRVTRQVSRRWDRDHDIVLVGWNADQACLRRLTPAERARGLGLTPPTGRADTVEDELVVPWRGTYLLPELNADIARLFPLKGMLRFSGCTSGVVGHDCVPLTSAETVADGMGAGFSMMLAALAYADRVATVSRASGQEYRGWAAMLAGTGLTPPQIEPVPLATETPPVTPEALAEAVADLDLDLDPTLPIVLCVGSHEPRKNHLAVTNAASVLWRQGVKFALVFVGGNSWRSEQFNAEVDSLLAAGHPLRLMKAISDETLAALYHVATCLIFPSYNEGFGLPVAESLAAGTPVITSGYGAMRETASDGGALLVDPRDDDSVVSALRTMLTDSETRERLVAEAKTFKVRTWDEYAAECWDWLVEGRRPTAPTDSAPTDSAPAVLGRVANQ